ncbi:uncharacterized protein LOC131844293 isoform X2 [Achroia grisella]|uniref:uncharacterized protein LOC131844293 isoform X2 n=1 Tax=Achroia grisella TaxID=688607 RepID=UPI0027D269C3|nr:uncharacterized protein LOC131844293 isoform X2 [Achroia grisella]
MAVKKCCIEKCRSCSTRKEDLGVTYHRYPKDVTLRNTWIQVTHNNFTNTDLATYVCSRHFRKSDFQMYKDSKYVLKSDAVPSIFPWSSIKTKTVNMNVVDIKKEKSETDSYKDSKESEVENLDAIKKFIEEQENEIFEKDKLDDKDIINNANVLDKYDQSLEERMSVASSMMDVILNESEALIAKKIMKPGAKQSLNSSDRGTATMSLSVGSKVEAKDFGEFWHEAEIAEVDYDEMEVLVHYENFKKHDEWISVSSPRLRPLGSGDNVAPSESAKEIHDAPPQVTIPVTVKEEIKIEEKPKLTFVEGERCLARWRDNRRFMATVTKDLGNGHYEIMFDDGFQWQCNASRMHKSRVSTTDHLTVDTTVLTTNTSVPSPIQQGGPSSGLTLPYHTHLFDPNRDYLGSKSERREMKRKLNIKEIFNIGQKRPKKQPSEKLKVAVATPPKVVKKKVKETTKHPAQCTVKEKIKNEIPEAVASIIGTFKTEQDVEEIEETSEETKTSEVTHEPVEVNTHSQEIDVTTHKIEERNRWEEDKVQQDINEETTSQTTEDLNKVSEEEMKLEKFDKEDEIRHEEVIDKIKEVITKIEDDLNKAENTSSPKPEIKDEPIKTENRIEIKADRDDDKEKKKLAKIKKGKKLRLLQERKVKKQVEKVKSELEEMKKQVEEMKKQMMIRAEELAEQKISAGFLLPGEWCCKWVNGQPVGKVSELETEVKDGNTKPGLPRRSVQVEDNRLPQGWTKHMVRRSFGHSAGKWDVVLVSPDNRRFHTKNEMRNYFENNRCEDIRSYEHVLMDFGVHLKLSRRIGWVTTTPGEADTTPVITLPAGTLYSTSPLVKQRKLSLKSKEHRVKSKKRKLGVSKIRREANLVIPGVEGTVEGVISVKPKLKKPRSKLKTIVNAELKPVIERIDAPVLEDGFVYVGALKVQIIDNLLRCPAEGCLKNFRNNTLLQMHIKHYHRELRKMMGRTPKVLDLAYARTMPTDIEPPKTHELKTVKVKIPRLPKRYDEVKHDLQEPKLEIPIETPTTPVKAEVEVPKQDSPKLRHALINKPVKRPRVLLPVRRVEKEVEISQPKTEDVEMELDKNITDSQIYEPLIEPLDFETAISTHTVTKPFDRKLKEKRLLTKLPISEDDEWFGGNSDMETRSSFPRSGTPDSKYMDQKPVSSESNEEQKESDMYMYTENGERIKIVHMKREEIINCHCGFREEDGLMVQCELCLCWQHALCHNIQKESEVPEKYTCSICLNPRRGRRSQRFLHDQDRLYEGLLPGAAACPSLRRSHELAGNLLRVQDALHACRLKYHVATKKNHPKLYLWAQDWENGDISQDKLNSDYSDLSIMINNIGKENLPVKDDMRDLDMRIDEDNDRFSQREGPLGPQTLLSGLLSSPGGASLELSLTSSELERLAKSVQEQDIPRVTAPQPEPAIENSVCRERLLRHIQRCQALIDARLDSIEAQVAELESQDPSFEDDETADYFPRTKQTIQMLMRDLDTMEELGAS